MQSTYFFIETSIAKLQASDGLHIKLKLTHPRIVPWYSLCPLGQWNGPRPMLLSYLYLFDLDGRVDYHCLYVEAHPSTSL